MNGLHFGCRMLFAFLEISSGLLHVADPHGFQLDIMGYGLVSVQVAALLATLLPIVHISLGVFLLIGRFVEGSFLLSAILFGAYGFAGAFALSRGLDISCGCFGAYSPQLSSGHVWGLFILAFSALVPVWRICVVGRSSKDIYHAT